MLQQYLPLAVLKQDTNYLSLGEEFKSGVATVPTACGIETLSLYVTDNNLVARCNSTYRLRY